MAEHIRNGQLEIITTTEDIYVDVINFHKENFLRYENLCLVCDINQSAAAVTEAGTRLKAVLQNGLSFGVRQTKTNNLVAVCINKFLPSTPSAPYENDCLKKLGESLACVDNAFDILKEWEIDCAMEICYLGTRQDFNGYGLATTLAKHAVNFAQQLLQGTANFKDLKPKAVMSFFTSAYTEKIGQKLGMQTVYKISFADLYYEHKPFADKIEPVHKYLTIAAMRL